MPLTFAAAAALCGVDKSTIRRAARAGRIDAWRAQAERLALPPPRRRWWSFS